MDSTNIITIVFICTGCFLFMTGSIGLVRFPDFYARMHATGKSDTLAVFFCLFGFIARVFFVHISPKHMRDKICS